MRYLIAETSWKTVGLSKAVSDRGTLVTRCEAGEEIEDFHKIGEHDLVVFDAIQLLRQTSLVRLRELHPDSPIVLIARSPDAEQIAAWLTAGADTVIDETAPLAEMIARIDAIARRAQGAASPRLNCGPLTFDLDARRVHLGDVTLSLSPKLYEILEYIALRPGRLAARESLLGHVYGFENEPAPRVFDVYMCNLRAHLAGIADAVRIETVRGAGYRLELVEPAGAQKPLAA
ncbi:cell division protein [Salipiger aestuarii]|uniref:winged helix-turn-helix domain-containing protein n=1 Tax=Salipiger aestuarii TaxID=568098 RepID=UPI00025B5F61|nr:response regulator transcription factor [Salipiger aestuarii]EIE52196.1 cell cycle transcriptional regulator CtrA [Citreicella sp. 357]KAA8608402.1 cell division protein [Salipiger aestuarii]KAA8612321.1 cell division protein [Salipiger aestuarii]